MVLLLPVQRSVLCNYLTHRAAHKLCVSSVHQPRSPRCRLASFRVPVSVSTVTITTDTGPKKSKSKSNKRNKFREVQTDQASHQPQAQFEAPAQTAVAVHVTLGPINASEDVQNPPVENSVPVRQATETSNILPFDGARHRALVLDAAYRPINVITWIKAVKMDMAGRADVLEYYTDACVTSSVKAFPMPAVVRARKMLNLDAIIGNGKVSLTRKNIMLRDKFTCLYCGCKKPPGDLSIDHVQPISKGGKNTWDNLATACKMCNQKKGNMTLKQVGWKLRGPLRQPTPYELGNLVQGVNPSDMTSPPPEWVDYLLPYIRKLQGRHGQAAAHQSS